MKPLKIGYVTLKNPHDKVIWSGLIYNMHVALDQHAGQVEIIGFPRPLSIRLFRHAILTIRKLTRQMSAIMPSLTYSWVCGQFFSRKIRQSGCDIVFAPVAELELAYLKSPVPVIYFTDGPFKARDGYYFKTSDVSSFDRWRSNLIQQRTFDNADAAIVASPWAAGFAINDYGKDPAAITVVPFGANIKQAPDPATLGAGSTDGKCRLLFVSVDWVRKGGQIAYEAMQSLRARGIDAQLTIVGCTPNIEDPNVRIVPFLNKSLPEDGARLEQLYREADFFVLPTRAECMGVVFCEASAFGCPSLATDTGGVSSAVENGVNGFVLPFAATGVDYADKIADLWADPAARLELRRTTRERYDKVLNWKSWAESVQQVMLRLLAAKHPTHP